MANASTILRATETTSKKTSVLNRKPGPLSATESRIPVHQRLMNSPATRRSR